MSVVLEVIDNPEAPRPAYKARQRFANVFRIRSGNHFRVYKTGWEDRTFILRNGGQHNLSKLHQLTRKGQR